MVTLLLLLVRAAAALAVAFLVAHALRRRSATLRADLWRATFVALAFLPIATATLPALRWVPAARETAESTLAFVVTSTGLSSTVVREVEAPAMSDRSALADSSAAAAPLANVAPTTTSGIDARTALSAAVLAVWLVGVLVLLARFGFGLRRAASIAREARRRVHDEERFRIATSERATGPFVWDPRPFGAPTVVLPASSDGDDAWRRAVLTHELHHVERRDGAFLALATVVAALLWPTLLARLALSRLRLETERSADDAVVRAGSRASDYARGLVLLASRPAALPVPSMAATGTVTRRVESLLDADADRRTTGRTARVGLACAALLACAPIAALAQETEDAPAEDPSPVESMRDRALDALVALHDTESGAWLGDVGYKLNYDWRVTDAGVPHVGVTGLAIEALVLAGTKPGDTPRGRALSLGIDFLLEAQGGDGYLSKSGTRMRSHAYALRGLATALMAGVDDDRLGPAVEAAARFTSESRSIEPGGWRFIPYAQDSDILETAYQFDAVIQSVRSVVATDAERAAALARVHRSNREVYAFVESLRIAEGGEREELAGAFRYQQAVYARVTPNTIAAGMLVMGAAFHQDRERGLDNLRRIGAMRDQRAKSLDASAEHFLTWDAELLAERMIEGHARGDIPELDAWADTWRGSTRAWLAENQRPDGSWRCSTGTGDAYATAIACLLLAENG